MDEIILNLIVLGSLLVLGGAIFFFIRNKQNQERQRLVELAKKNAWQLEFIQERLTKGVRITSHEWALETLKRTSDQEAGPGSSNIEQITTWSASLPGTTILIGPKYSKTNNLPSMDLVIRQIIQKTIGEDAKDLQEIKMGTASFQSQFMIWAKDEQEAESLLTPALISTLLSWEKGSPLIKRTSKGITLELRGVYLRKPEDFLSLIQLGKKLS